MPNTLSNVKLPWKSLPYSMGTLGGGYKVRMMGGLTLRATSVPSLPMSMMGVPPSLFSSAFWGRKRHTTLILLPDMI